MHARSTFSVMRTVIAGRLDWSLAKSKKTGKDVGQVVLYNKL